jgi:molecular chaperone DnaJ
VALAYETLSDPQRRQQYDRFGEDGPQAGNPFGGGGGLGDIFDMFFNGGSPFGGQPPAPSGPPRGSDLEVVVDLEFVDAVFGAEAPVSVRTAVACDDCEATGAAPGTSPSTCPECAGAGQVRRVRQSILGQMVTAGPCNRCSGFGTIVASPCPTCRGEGRTVDDRTYTVDVPAGVDTGVRLQMPGSGEAGPAGGPNGDLYLEVKVKNHEVFSRNGDDLLCTLEVQMTDAVLGTNATVEALDGDVDLELKPGVQSGEILTVKDRGITHLRGGGRGDLKVAVHVVTPTKLSHKERELVQQLAKARKAQPPQLGHFQQGLFARLRDRFLG